VVLVGREVARDVVEVRGPDSVTYLQGQVSQDVEHLDVGATSWTFVLQPAGKVDAWCRITRTAEDAYLLDVDGGSGKRLIARLQRFLLRTKAEVTFLQGWHCIAVRGAGADEAVANAPGAAELRVPAGWPGIEGSDLLGASVTFPSGVKPVGAEAFSALRIQAGVPAMGAELTDKTIPAEVGQWIIDASVDFTKGCFTGQELVARIDSRGGNVPRHLHGLLLDGPVAPSKGAVVHVGDAEVGSVTSAAWAAPLQRPVALAYIARSVEPGPDGVEAVVTWGDGASTADARVRTLPLPLLPAD
jgi:folate-binding protein YgfZ